MTPDENKAYQRGYRSGRKRRAVDERGRKADAERAAFRRRAFLAALPACLASEGWKIGDKPVTTLDQRIDLAWLAANKALKQFW
jgi:hypothetical protein